MSLNEQNFQDPVRVKVVVIGDMCVGKTAIAHRFTKNAFEEKLPHTVGASYYIRSMEIEGRTILFQIWDTAGQERFRSLVPMYLRDADIALLVYDITSKETFHSLELWRTELLTSAPCHVTTAVVGNKSDLGAKRQIESTVRIHVIRAGMLALKKTGRAYAVKHRMLYTETSAKLGTNVEELFYDLVVIIGDSGVGKTSIAQRFAQDSFSENTAMSVGAGYFVKHLEIEDRKVQFQIWDTAGQENFRSLVPMFLRDAKIALLVYDITSMESFLNLEAWQSDLLTAEPEVTVAVIGNKSDLKDYRKVEVRKGQGYANRHKMLFTETSAKRGTNVEEIFFELGSQLLQRNVQEKSEQNIKVGPGESMSKKVRDCCL
ncbi:uncharacterized protein LOC128155482 [Crassostrea angulata]|uniref:uncharacterized protein LOC128155482 n=1 Tax=Magallana angulata TaxID=2784310 RepID=UPI0022B1441F|nr:uncharacterized protein LOC128155482 [Crassostrea angulata]